ncbi:hypothetical protein NQ317_000786 [Molorchus minor]|uniref:DUF4806 domain-containing protein n=1 Tax=Molorchus minor TaxID=1323400 RepID=A0ABQ9J5Z4_9CUCU|nr:hypothetical protein NQ317_000786 [Molorchus minor]
MPCKIDIKYKTDVYQKAVLKLKQLELSSDVNTEDEKTQKRPTRGVKRYTEDFTSTLNSDSSVSISPPTPPNKCLKIVSRNGEQQAKSVPTIIIPLESHHTPKTSCIDELSGNYQVPVYIETTQTTAGTTPLKKSLKVASRKDQQQAKPVPTLLTMPFDSHPTLKSPCGDDQSGNYQTPIYIETTRPTTVEAITCSSCSTIEGLCRRILEEINKNRNKLEELTHFVHASIVGKDDVTLTPANVEGMPLNTIEDMDSLETRLGNKQEYANVLNVLKFVGGRDTFDTTRRIMSRVIHNNLALIINWIGRNNKPAFRGYKNILSLISDAVRVNPLAARASEQEIFSIIKVWLRGAVDRDGGRNKRKKGYLRHKEDKEGNKEE